MSDVKSRLTTGFGIVLAGHLMGHRQAEAAFEYLDYSLEDLDGPRNGVLWAPWIECAYEDSRICFVYSKEERNFRLHLLDENLRHVYCKDFVRKNLKGGSHRVTGELQQSCTSLY